MTKSRAFHSTQGLSHGNLYPTPLSTHACCSETFNNPSCQVAEAVSVLRGGSTASSVMVTSNLRRAIATGLITLWDRLRRGEERLLVHSALQVYKEGDGKEVRFDVDFILLCLRCRVLTTTHSIKGISVVFRRLLSTWTAFLCWRRGRSLMKVSRRIWVSR